MKEYLRAYYFGASLVAQMGKNLPGQCRKSGFDPWVEKIPWRREWQPTLAFLPGEFHGHRSLGSYSPYYPMTGVKNTKYSVISNSSRHDWATNTLPWLSKWILHGSRTLNIALMKRFCGSSNKIKTIEKKKEWGCWLSKNNIIFLPDRNGELTVILSCDM